MARTSEEITEIFQENYPNLCRFLESIVGRDNQAQDIAQESFLRLCRTNLDNISPPEVRFWLFRVARNLALNELSKNNTRAGLLSRFFEFFEKKPPHPEEELLRNETQKTVRKLLKRLPEHQRSALLLREQEEMTYREIALTLEISESKVKIDIFRARQALHAMWSKPENER